MISARTVRQKFALAAVLTLLVVLLVPPPSARAGTGLGVVPTFPTQVQVGETYPGSLTVTNVSTDDEAVGNITVTEISMVPSCSNFQPDCAGGTADPQTFTLSPTGVGRAGTACEGQVFNITQDPTTGEATFTPADGQPVVLGPPTLANDLDTCAIDYTLTVNKVPNHDSFPGTPGVQTNQVGFAFAQHQNGTIGTGTGSDVTTVVQAAPTIVTQATPTATIGQPIEDTATLSGGGTGPSAPTGTITFNVYGPDDADCTGAPVFTSTCLLYTSPSPRDRTRSRMPSSA